jgi:UDP-N-acetylglucosamine:LPS N-acetylglucosamine transferase
MNAVGELLAAPPGGAAPPWARTDRRPRVLVVSGSVGAGHDGAAHELAGRLATAGAEVVVRDFLAAVPRAAARLLREGYSGTVTHVPLAFEFLFRRLERRALLWQAERFICARAEPTVAAWAAGHRADVVVSTYPLASQALGELRADGRLRVPVITYLTDPAAHVSWVHPAVDRHVTVTAATAAQGAADYGLPFDVAGPLVPARFAVRPDPSRLAAVRRELALPRDRPVALLVSGSLGLGDVVRTARAVAAAGLTPLVLCGRNDGLRRSVARDPRAVALGWRTDVHQLVHLADVLVQNAGGLSFTEALVAGLPTVTYRPSPGHGRANAQLLDAAGLAPWARTPEQLAASLHAAVRLARRVPVFPDPAALVLSTAAAPGPDGPLTGGPVRRGGVTSGPPTRGPATSGRAMRHRTTTGRAA